MSRPRSAASASLQSGWALAFVAVGIGAMALVDVTPGAGVEFIRRSTPGGASAVTSVTGLTAPRWLRLTRSGNSITSYHSANGLTWTPIGTNTNVESHMPTKGVKVSSFASFSPVVLEK